MSHRDRDGGTDADLDMVVVVGGGTMGAGIAQALLAVGVAVHLVERDEVTAEAAERRIEAQLRRSALATGGGSGQLSDALDRLVVGSSLPGEAVPALVIESVPESLELKRDVLELLSRAFPGALLASNTSALSIDALAERVEDGARFLGMHFFNPVPRSALVELVSGARTSAEAMATAERWVQRLGKESIQVRDAPGFATSRLGIAMGLEAIRMVEEGVARPDDIDRGMVLGYRLPMGPLELGDLVGLDVRLSIAEHLHAELGERFAPPALLRDMVARGELGRKTGRGFYRWSADGRRVSE